MRVYVERWDSFGNDSVQTMNLEAMGSLKSARSSQHQRGIQLTFTSALHCLKHVRVIIRHRL